MTLKMAGISIDPTTLVGYHAGVVVEFPLGGNFCLQPSVLYSAKGSKYSIMGEKMEAAPTFIDVPINLMYKFDLGAVKLFLGAGGYVSYGIGGKVEYNGESADITWGSDDNSDMKPLDYGLNGLAGLDIKKP